MVIGPMAFNFQQSKGMNNVGSTLENKYENLRRLWWFIMKDVLFLAAIITLTIAAAIQFGSIGEHITM
jgi:hypothetical protein